MKLSEIVGQNIGSSTFSVELPAQDIAYRRTYEVDHQAEGSGIAIASST